MTPDGHFIVDRLPGAGGLLRGQRVQRRRPVDLAADRGGPRRLDRRGRRSGRGRSSRSGIDRFDDRYEDDDVLRADCFADVRAQVRQGRGGGPTTRRRRHSRGRATDEPVVDPPRRAARKRRSRSSRRTATGLVRQVSLLQQIVFNLASSNALGLGPRVLPRRSSCCSRAANIYVALLIAGVGELLRLDDVRAAQLGAIPRIGGDYTINSRVLPPWLALGGNIGSFMGGLFGVPIFGYFMATLALSPALAVIGGVTGSDTLTQVEHRTSQPTTRTSSSSPRSRVVALMSVLAYLGTRLVHARSAPCW